MIEIITACIIQFSKINKLDPVLVSAVIAVESNYDPKALGLAGEVGLMQIQADVHGLKAKQLLDPCTNIKHGTKFLREVKDICVHKDKNTFVICYNKGVYGGSKIKHPTKDSYYKKVMIQYEKKIKVLSRKQ